ncbi:Protein pleiotropic regulatory locus 1 [Diplonema papillatum]|nr:Protein pleiotropic regulatory locus 1 [Diplonema papillatum]
MASSGDDGIEPAEMRVFCVGLMQRMAGRLGTLRERMRRGGGAGGGVIKKEAFVAEVTRVVRGPPAAGGGGAGAHPDECDDEVLAALLAPPPAGGACGGKRPAAKGLRGRSRLALPIARPLFKPPSKQQTAPVDGSVASPAPQPSPSDRASSLFPVGSVKDGSLSDRMLGVYASDSSLAEYLARLHAILSSEGAGPVHWVDFIVFLIDATTKAQLETRLRPAADKMYRLTSTSHSTFYRLLRIVHSPVQKAFLVVTRCISQGKVKKTEFEALRIIDDDTLKQKKQLSLTESAGKISALCFIDTVGNFIAAAYGDGRVRIFEADELHLVMLLPAFSCLMRDELMRSTHRCEPNCPYIRNSDVKCCQTLLTWCPSLKVLFTGSRQGALGMWDMSCLESRNAKGPSELWAVQVHKAAVTSLVFLRGDCKRVATGSLDATIAVVDLEKKVIIRRLSGHASGITSMSHNPQMDYLVSAGIEPAPRCWAVNVLHSKPMLLTGKTPHAYSIVSVRTVPYTSHVMTMDKKGNIKFWDLRTGACYESICCGELIPASSAPHAEWKDCTYNQRTKCFVTACFTASALHFVEENPPPAALDPNAAVDHPLAAVCYVAARCAFLTISLKEMWLWSAVDGSLLAKLRPLDEDGSCAHCDSKGEVAYIGTRRGEVLVCDLSTGLVKRRWRHPSQYPLTIVKGVTDGMLLAVAADGALQVVRDDGRVLEGTSLTKGRKRRLNVLCVAVNPAHEHVLFGCGNNEVMIYDTGLRALHFNCRNSPEGFDVTAIEALLPHSIFASSDGVGGIHVWSVPPLHSLPSSKASPTLLHRLVTHNPPCQPPAAPIVTHLSWMPGNGVLYAADNTDFVNGYAVRAAYSRTPGPEPNGAVLGDFLPPDAPRTFLTEYAGSGGPAAVSVTFASRWSLQDLPARFGGANGPCSISALLVHGGCGAGGAVVVAFGYHIALWSLDGTWLGYLTEGDAVAGCDGGQIFGKTGPDAGGGAPVEYDALLLPPLGKPESEVGLAEPPRAAAPPDPAAQRDAAEAAAFRKALRRHLRKVLLRLQKLAPGRDAAALVAGTHAAQPKSANRTLGACAEGSPLGGPPRPAVDDLSPYNYRALLKQFPFDNNTVKASGRGGVSVRRHAAVLRLMYNLAMGTERIGFESSPAAPAAAPPDPKRRPSPSRSRAAAADDDLPAPSSAAGGGWTDPAPKPPADAEPPPAAAAGAPVARQGAGRLHPASGANQLALVGFLEGVAGVADARPRRPSSSMEQHRPCCVVVNPDDVGGAPPGDPLLGRCAGGGAADEVEAIVADDAAFKRYLKAANVAALTRSKKAARVGLPEPRLTAAAASGLPAASHRGSKQPAPGASRASATLHRLPPVHYRKRFEESHAQHRAVPVDDRQFFTAVQQMPPPRPQEKSPAAAAADESPPASRSSDALEGRSCLPHEVLELLQRTDEVASALQLKPKWSLSKLPLFHDVAGLMGEGAGSSMEKVSRKETEKKLETEWTLRPRHEAKRKERKKQEAKRYCISLGKGCFESKRVLALSSVVFDEVARGGDERAELEAIVTDMGYAPTKAGLEQLWQDMTPNDETILDPSSFASHKNLRVTCHSTRRVLDLVFELLSLPHETRSVLTVLPEAKKEFLLPCWKTASRSAQETPALVEMLEFILTYASVKRREEAVGKAWDMCFMNEIACRRLAMVRWERNQRSQEAPETPASELGESMMSTPVHSPFSPIQGCPEAEAATHHTAAKQGPSRRTTAGSAYTPGSAPLPGRLAKGAHCIQGPVRSSFPHEVDEHTSEQGLSRRLTPAGTTVACPTPLLDRNGTSCIQGPIRPSFTRGNGADEQTELTNERRLRSSTPPDPATAATPRECTQKTRCANGLFHAPTPTPTPPGRPPADAARPGCGKGRPEPAAAKCRWIAALRLENVAVGYTPDAGAPAFRFPTANVIRKLAAACGRPLSAVATPLMDVLEPLRGGCCTVPDLESFFRIFGSAEGAGPRAAGGEEEKEEVRGAVRRYLILARTGCHHPAFNAAAAGSVLASLLQMSQRMLTDERRVANRNQELAAAARSAGITIAVEPPAANLQRGSRPQPQRSAGRRAQPADADGLPSARPPVTPDVRLKGAFVTYPFHDLDGPTARSSIGVAWITGEFEVQTGTIRRRQVSPNGDEAFVFSHAASPAAVGVDLIDCLYANAAILATPLGLRYSDVPWLEEGLGDGFSPLHHAALANNVSVAGLLLGGGQVTSGVPFKSAMFGRRRFDGERQAPATESPAAATVLAFLSKTAELPAADDQRAGARPLDAPSRPAESMFNGELTKLEIRKLVVDLHDGQFREPQLLEAFWRIGVDDAQLFRILGTDEALQAAGARAAAAAAKSPGATSVSSRLFYVFTRALAERSSQQPAAAERQATTQPRRPSDSAVTSLEQLLTLHPLAPALRESLFEYRESYTRSLLSHRWTVLHCALHSKAASCEVILQFFLDEGADPNAADAHGKTPLSYAVERQRTPEVLLLLRSGALYHNPPALSPLLTAVCSDGLPPSVPLIELLAGISPGGADRPRAVAACADRIRRHHTHTELYKRAMAAIRSVERQRACAWYAGAMPYAVGLEETVSPEVGGNDPVQLGTGGSGGV